MRAGFKPCEQMRLRSSCGFGSAHKLGSLAANVMLGRGWYPITRRAWREPGLYIHHPTVLGGCWALVVDRDDVESDAATKGAAARRPPPTTRLAGIYLVLLIGRTMRASRRSARPKATTLSVTALLASRHRNCRLQRLLVQLLFAGGMLCRGLCSG